MISIQQASAVTVDVSSGELGYGTDITTGSDGLTKTGGGTLTIWSAQPYTGTTVISAGKIMIAGGGAISASSALQLGSGSSIDLTGFYAPDNINRTFAGLTGAGIVYGRGGTVTINKVSGSDTFSGDIQGGQGLIKNGAGTLVLSGANTYTGGTTISGGTLDLNGGSVVGNIANNGNLSIRSDLVNVVSGTGSLTKEGSGIAALWNPNTYTGATVINAGQLMLAGGGAISSASEVRIASGATMRLDGYYAPANINRTIGGLTGAGVLYSSGGTVTVNKTSGINTFSGDIQGGQGLIKDGAGTLVLSGANTYTGTTAVNAGLLKVVSGGSISSSSTTVNNGGTFDVGGTAGSLQVNSGGLLKGSGSVGAFTLASGGALTPGNSPGTLTAASAIVLGGSTYKWEISALTGGAGTTWDLFSVTGLLDMSGVTSGNKWNLLVTGDSGFTGWTGTDSYSYVFAQAASVSGFSSTVGTDVTSLFNISTSGITSKPNASFNANGDFKVVVGSDNGRTTLNLMAVPEPSTGILFVVGFGLLIALRRRKTA